MIIRHPGGIVAGEKGNTVEIVKIGGVELTEEIARRFFEEGKYIVTYSKIYQIFWSAAQKKFYGMEIYHSPRMTQRGRFFAMSAESVNNLIGFQLLNTQ